jgi:hypothetical protein
MYEHLHNFISIGKKQVDFEQFYDIVSALEIAAEEGNMYLEKKEEGDEDEGDELSEEDLKEVAKELFNELKGIDIISPTKICIFIYRYMYICIYTYIHNMTLNIFIYKYSSMHIYIDMCIYTYIFIYIFI